MKTIYAVHENGVFRPLEMVNLPDACRVEFEPQPMLPEGQAADQADICATLKQRYYPGQTDVAECHDEH